MKVSGARPRVTAIHFSTMDNEQRYVMVVKVYDEDQTVCLYKEEDVTEEDKEMLGEYADITYDSPREVYEELQDKFDEFETKSKHACLYQCIRANISFVVFIELRGTV
jgi:transcription initiation factor TFIID subunit TAF12